MQSLSAEGSRHLMDLQRRLPLTWMKAAKGRVATNRVACNDVWRYQFACVGCFPSLFLLVSSDAGVFFVCMFCVILVSCGSLFVLILSVVLMFCACMCHIVFVVFCFYIPLFGLDKGLDVVK